MTTIEPGAPPPAALWAAPVLDASGQSRALGTFWRDAPVLLVFLRHFG